MLDFVHFFFFKLSKSILSLLLKHLHIITMQISMSLMQVPLKW